MSRNYACMAQEKGKTDVNMLEMAKNKTMKKGMKKSMGAMPSAKSMKKGMK